VLDTNVALSKKVVGIYDGFISWAPANFYLAQLAPDEKIYVICGSSTYDIHVINNPDSAGLACDFCQHCIHLPAFNAFTIPNHPNYFLGPDSNSICDTLHIDVPSIASTNISYNLFPNPTRNILYITQDLKEKLNSLRILNSIGQEQVVNYTSIKNGYVEVNTSSLSSGIYFLELLTDRQKVVKRFVRE